MARRPLLYYITDRTQFSGDEPARRRALLDKIAEATRCGVDYIQLREKDLSARDLEILGRQAAAVIRAATSTATGSSRTRLLINSRTDMALATGAAGVHLRSDDVSPATVRSVWNEVFPSSSPIIAVSCHTPDDISLATANGADLAVFAPVFEKGGTAPAGLDNLRIACRARIPVLALGGVTLENAQSCLDAGAAGLAAIRLFQHHPIADIVRFIRPRN